MIAVIDITGNNLTSIANAIDRLGFESCLTHDPKTIERASHVILPGVGTVGAAMQALQKHHLIDLIGGLRQPLLGICVGMQLLFESSEEGNEKGLGLLSGQVKRLPSVPGFSIPHMGWNNMTWLEESPLSQGLKDDDYFYFVHSYAILSHENTIARCHFSTEFTAVVQKDHIYGVQFHPEKSALVGMTLLNNFLRLTRS
ncbi:MAG: imidazole glycerol phosphate synthase subunit HisH [Verrucomicrobiae bacterium]|jgi:glutamine amidotransferase|nr:imidazole glycerol phosphate synthase subunit HisH [Verrucomicrobiae bacterium]